MFVINIFFARMPCKGYIIGTKILKLLYIANGYAKFMAKYPHIFY